MKKITLALAVALAGLFTLAAEDVNVFCPGFLAPSKDFRVWCAKGMAVDSQVKEGKITITIKESGIEKVSTANIQAMILHTADFKTGAKYRLEANVTSSIDFTLATSVYLSKPPWSGLGSKTLNLKAGVPQKLEIIFTPKADAAGLYRVPGMNIGNAPVGAVFEITDYKLVEVK